MIDTRGTIFKTVLYRLNRMFKLGIVDDTVFKNIIYASILADMKEWSEAICDGKNKLIEEILTKFLLCHPEFKIERFIPKHDKYVYRNVNTPQSNNEWDIVKINPWIKPEKDESITVDSCVEFNHNIITFNNCADGIIELGL